MPESNPMRGIRRIDRPQKSIHGFEVRIERDGKYHSKFFSDGTHGGRDLALAAAQAQYPKLLAQVGPPAERERGPHMNLTLGGSPALAASGPPPGALVWVQCSDRRCMAYRDNRGRWVNFYTRRRLKDFIRIVG